MTLSHGQQAEFPFSNKTEKAGSKQKLQKKKYGKRIREKRRPEPEHRTRKERVKASPEIPQTTGRKEAQEKEARITFPLRLSIPEHAEWKEFASKNRFSLHQLVKNAMADVIARNRQGKSIPWLKIG